MKYFLLLLFCSISATSSTHHSLKISVIGACSARPLLESVESVLNGVDLGTASMLLFARKGIPHKGTKSGFNSIFNTPTGLDAMEVFGDADEKMRAYGWCFLVNGVLPLKYADDISVERSGEELTWFYGYSYYDSGKWLSMCEPAYLIRPSFLCNSPD